MAAETSLGRALAEHSRVGQPVDRARTLLVLGSLLRRRRQPAAARAILLEALGVLEHCGASLWAARVRAELARLPARAAAPDDLTETERVIARLVAIGRTNREVATALSIAAATLCIVFVQSTTLPAPAAAMDLAELASSAPACSQSPACCRRSIS